MQIIEWCNNNNGFISAILAILGLLISTIAIIVSIHTARIPYKKNIKLTASTDIHLFSNPLSKNVSSEVVGITVNAVNLGTRSINLTYLGLGFKERAQSNRFQKLTKVKEAPTGVGIILPTEIKAEAFDKKDIQYCLSKISEKTKVYLTAQDSEGKTYRKKFGRAGAIIKGLTV